MCRNSCNYGLTGYEGIHNVSVSIIDINLRRRLKVTTLHVQECVLRLSSIVKLLGVSSFIPLIHGLGCGSEDKGRVFNSSPN